MSEASIYCLFPKTVYLKNINYIDDKYLLSLNKFCKNLNYIKIPSEDLENASQSSEDRYLFNKHKILFKLKDIILKEFNDFKNNLLSYTYNSFKITTSWIAKVDKGKQANIHNHNNSFYSGVFYINAEKDMGNISFHNFETTRYLPKVETSSLLNSRNFSITPKNKDLIFFPSELFHKIKKNNNNKTRLSIAFNIIPEGVIGGGDSELII
jgi:uncharacterized protein (TIGR02466 family)